MKNRGPDGQNNKTENTINNMSVPSSSSSLKIVGGWTLEEAIGKGAQATVYRAHDKDKKTVAAIKEISFDQFEDNALSVVKAEVQLIMHLNHPFVIRLLDHFFQDNFYYIVYEYIERGSLYKAIKTGVFTNDVAKRIVRELLLGLNYIHKQGIIHRDIKADNILIDRNNNIKIADFGISMMKGTQQVDPDAMNDFGSPYWMAPEVIEMQQPTTKSDIWSVGCLTLELLTGKPPYFNLTAMSALFHICADAAIPIEDTYHNITQECLQFLAECFQKDATRRKSAEELLDHPWFKSHITQTEKRIAITASTPARVSYPRSLNRENSGRDCALSTGPAKPASTMASRKPDSVQRPADRQRAATRPTSRILMNQNDVSEVLDGIDLDDLAEALGLDDAPPHSITSQHTPSIDVTTAPPRSSPSGSVGQSASTKDGLPSSKNSEAVVKDLDSNLFESEIIVNIQILAEAVKKDGRQTEASLCASLQQLLQHMIDHEETCSVLVSNNGLYPLLSVVLVNIDNSVVCLLALKIIKDVMVRDSQTHMPLLMMGLLSVLTHYITNCFQSSSASQNKVKPASKPTAGGVADTNEQLMLICVYVLQLLCSNTGCILDVIFTSGLINSAVQILDANKLYYVDCGINCLISEYNYVNTIPSDILVDILYSIGVIKFLFSGLVFCVSLNTNNAYYTASKLLDFLLLYTEQGKKDYLSSILSNNGLDIIVYALKIDENSTEVSTSDLLFNLDSNSSCLNEYKLRVLKLMKNLQAVHNNLFDYSVLDFLLPLLHSKYPVLVEMNLDLLSNLITFDSSQRILVSAINSNIIATLQSLMTNCGRTIFEKSVRLFIMIGGSCLKPSTIQKSLYDRFRQALCCEYLFDNIVNETLCSEILSLLTHFVVIDREYMVQLTRNHRKIQTIIDCYAVNLQHGNDNNIYSLIDYIQCMPEVLSDLSLNRKFMEMVLSNIVSGTNVNQSSGLLLLISLCKATPDKLRLNTMFGVVKLIKSIAVTKANRKALSYLFAIFPNSV